MTDQQSAALEPCPFCGYTTTLQLCQSQASGWWYVQCNACSIKGPGVSWEEREPGPAAIHAWNLRAPAVTNTRPAPAGAEAVREALTGCMAALKSARSWFETIAEAPEDEADGFVEEAKNVVDAAYFNADCALDALNDLATPQPAPTAAEAELREAAERVVGEFTVWLDVFPDSEDLVPSERAALMRLRNALRAKPATPTKEN